jgi:hypothetical protein
MAKQWLGVAVGVTLVGLLIWQWPEIERYRRLSMM